MDALLSAITKQTVHYPRTHHSLRTTSLLVNIYSACFVSPNADTNVSIVKLLSEFDDSGQIRLLPFGVANPILQAVYACRQAPPSGLAQLAYQVLGREDLVNISDDDSYAKLYAVLDDREDTAAVLNAVSKMRFSADNRLQEVCRLLCSSQPASIRVKQVHPPFSYCPHALGRPNRPRPLE